MGVPRCGAQLRLERRDIVCVQCPLGQRIPLLAAYKRRITWETPTPLRLPKTELISNDIGTVIVNFYL